MPIVRTSPYKSVQVRTSPYSLARTLCIAQCALPARGNALCFLENAQHMAHGGKPHFSPRVPPFRPVCCMEACGTQCGFFKLEALASSPPRAVRRRLSARWRHGAAAMWSAVGLAPSRASGRLAGHIAQSRYCGQGNTDEYGLIRTDTDLLRRRLRRASSTWRSVCHALRNF